MWCIHITLLTRSLHGKTAFYFLTSMWWIAVPVFASRESSLIFDPAFLYVFLEGSSEEYQFCLTNFADRLGQRCYPLGKLLLSNSLRVVQSAPTTTGITITIMFYSFFGSLASSKYFPLFSLFLKFSFRGPRQQRNPSDDFSFLVNINLVN